MYFFFSSRRRHTRLTCDWSSDVCSSDLAADPVSGTGKLTVYKAAPMLLFGFGNLVPRNGHFSATFEIGAAYQGPPRVALDLGGTACDSSGLFCRPIASDPTIQSNIAAEQTKLNKSASPYKFYPVVSFGFGYRF